MVDLDSEEYRKWKLGDDKYPCPRGCGQLTEIIEIVEKKKWKVEYKILKVLPQKK